MILATKAQKDAKKMPFHRDTMTKVWIIPSVLYNDERITQILHQLSKKVHSSIEIKPVDSSAIMPSHSGRVLLPCINIGNINRDVQAAVEKAKISKNKLSFFKMF